MSIEGYGAWEAVAGRYHARPCTLRICRIASGYFNSSSEIQV